MQLFSSITANGSSASATFSDIPQTATDLYVFMSIRGGSTNVTNYGFIYLNGSDQSAYLELYNQSGSTASRNSNRNEIMNGTGSSANYFSNVAMTISNYTTGSSKFGSLDSVTEENGGSSVWSGVKAVQWGVSGGVTSLTFTSPSGNISANSTFYLYGITKGSGGATVSTT